MRVVKYNWGMDSLKGCSSFREFGMRNCIEQHLKLRNVLALSDLRIHHYPVPLDEIPIEVKMRLEQCHDTDRLAVTVE